MWPPQTEGLPSRGPCHTPFIPDCVFQIHVWPVTGPAVPLFTLHAPRPIQSLCPAHSLRYPSSHCCPSLVSRGSCMTTLVPHTPTAPIHVCVTPALPPYFLSPPPSQLNPRPTCTHARPDGVCAAPACAQVLLMPCLPLQPSQPPHYPPASPGGPQEPSQAESGGPPWQKLQVPHVLVRV